MRVRIAALAISLALPASLLTACGSDEDSSTGSSAASTLAPLGSTAQPFNDADVAFAQGMIPHHQQAVEMATIALEPNVGASAQVVDLATRIKGAQDPEIQLMTSWLADWGASTSETTAGHGMDDETLIGEGMMTPDEMEALMAASGGEFDQMWMEMMIRHHEGAIAMSNLEISDGSSPDALDLARAIVAAQQAEIDEMNALLGT